MMELVQFQKNRQRFDDLGIGLVAITTDDWRGIEKARKRVGAEFPFVRDHEETLMDVFGLRDSAANPSGRDIMRSASILVSPDGEILWESRADSYRVRPTPDEILSGITGALMNGP